MVLMCVVSMDFGYVLVEQRPKLMLVSLNWTNGYKEPPCRNPNGGISTYKKLAEQKRLQACVAESGW
jgi:hypothetical protein